MRQILQKKLTSPLLKQKVMKDKRRLETKEIQLKLVWGTRLGPGTEKNMNGNTKKIIRFSE